MHNVAYRFGPRILIRLFCLGLFTSSRIWLWFTQTNVEIWFFVFFPRELLQQCFSLMLVNCAVHNDWLLATDRTPAFSQSPLASDERWLSMDVVAEKSDKLAVMNVRPRRDGWWVVRCCCCCCCPITDDSSSLPLLSKLPSTSARRW